MSKRVNLREFEGFSEASQEEKKEIKKAVGNFLTGSIVEFLSNSNSPVSGQGKFKRTKEGKASDLFETGDLYASFDFIDYRDGIDVGVFDDDAPKMFGHNTGFKGHPTIKNGPKRQAIPDKKQKFKAKINTGIQKTIDGILDGSES